MYSLFKLTLDRSIFSFFCAFFGSFFKIVYNISMNDTVYFSRTTGDASSAVSYFEESVNFLKKMPKDNLEVDNYSTWGVAS